MVKEALNGVPSGMKSGDPTETIRFAEFSRQVFGPDFVLGGKKARQNKRKSKKGKFIRRGSSGADFRQDHEMSPEKRQFNRTLKRSDANMRAAFKSMNNFEHLEKIIQQKLHSKTSSGGMELLRLFRLIDKDKNMTIDLQEFEEALLRFNLNLEKRDVKRLFDHYDKTGTGGISYYDFIKHLVPDDFLSLEKLKSMGGIPGMSKRDVQREMLDAAAKRATLNAKRGSVGLGSNKQVEKVLRDKIMTNLSSGPYELVRMFRMFDLDGNGEIDFSEFKEVLHKFNITIPEDQMLTLFKSYDKDARGAISYYNFLHHVLPSDFPDVGKDHGAEPEVSLGRDTDGRTNDVARRNPYFAKAEKRNKTYVRRAFRGHGDFRELEKILRGKIQEKTKSGGVELLRLFRQFDKDGNQAIDLDEFRDTLRIYNLDLEESDLTLMFKQYDKDNDGLINYYEFIRHLLPNDFIPLSELKSMGGLPGMTTSDHSRDMLSKAARNAERNVKLGGAGLALHDPKHVRNLLKQKVMMKTKGGARELWQAFRHFDKDGSGDIDFDEFYNVVVNHYNIDLPREEVRAMFMEFIERGKAFKAEHQEKLDALRSSKGAQKIPSAELVDRKNTVDEDMSPLSKETTVADPHEILSKTAWDVPLDGSTIAQSNKYHPRLQKVVKRRWRAMLNDLSSIDTTDSGLVSRAEARYVFGKYRVTLSDKEIISLLPKNSMKTNGVLLDYRVFLANFGK